MLWLRLRQPRVADRAALIGVCLLTSASAIVFKASQARSGVYALASVAEGSVIDAGATEPGAQGVVPSALLSPDALAGRSTDARATTDVWVASKAADTVPVTLINPSQLAADAVFSGEAQGLVSTVARAIAIAGPGTTAFKDDLRIRYFNGRPVRPARVMTMLVTAYSPDAQSCGDSADGITSSIHNVYTNAMRLVAADTSILPLGTMISIPGYDEGRIVPVLDRGGAIKGRRLDVLYPTHERALQWGVQRLGVTIWEYADGLPSDNIRKIRDSRE